MGKRDQEADRAPEQDGGAAGLISDEYRKLLVEAHAEPGWGTSAQEHVEDVASLISQFDADTVLDYGCGKGVLSQVLDVTNYDPATYPELPEPHDLVVCIDVMEHVEGDSVEAVLAHIRSLTKKAAFFVISCQPAIKTLADGRNAHITICPPRWWRDKLHQVGFDMKIEHVAPGDKAYVAVCIPV